MKKWTGQQKEQKNFINCTQKMERKVAGGLHNLLLAAS